MPQYIAKSCGSKKRHGEHIHVFNGVAYACFGYTPVDEEDEIAGNHFDYGEVND